MKALLPGLYLLPVPIPYPLKTVNLYLLQGAGEVALVDTALGTRAARGALELHLAELGLCFQDVKTILLTHHHPDHYGLSGFFEGLGARVFLHEEEVARGHRFWREPEAFAEASWRLFLDHGTPEGALQGIRETVEKTRERVHPPQNPLPLRDGEALEVAGKRLRVLWTPGHADGHAAFYLEAEGVLLAGAALLADLGARVAYAGHFGPIADVRQRAEELKAHHQARLEALLALLDGPKTAWELSLHLFPQELDPAGRRFAFAETLAHLEYLREEGAVGRGGPPYRYFRR